MLRKTRGRAPIERPKGRGTLTLDGSTTLRVSFRIEVYQNYLEGDGIKEKADYFVRGEIVPVDRIRGGILKCGEDTNVLDLGEGRKVDILAPEIILQDGFTFNSLHDEMTFFETDFYRRRGEES